MDMNRFQPTVYVFLLAILGAGVSESTAQWPQFRGANGSGVDSGGGYPVAFSPTSNVVWKAAMPFGQSSPVVAGGRVYLTASEGGKLLTISLDAATGREVWRRDLKPAHSHKVYHANDPASPTPAADADGVVVFFPDFGLAAYAADGKERWTMPLGPFKSFYGMSASPIIAGDLVVLLCDQRAGSFLVAVDRKTGKMRWRKERPGAPEGWSTPMVFRATADAPAQIVTLGTTRIDSYALETGESRWWMPVGSSGSMGIPVASGETLFVTTSGGSEPNLPAYDTVLAKLDTDKNGQLSHKEFLADKEMGEHFGWLDENGDEGIDAKEWQTIRMMGMGESGAVAIQAASANGKVDPASVMWRVKKNLPYIPAPLHYKNVLYLVKTGGIITSFDPMTGRVMKEGRSINAPGEYYASPIAADDKVFVASVDGKVSVLKAGADWQLLGVNDIGEPIHATPALGGGRIYVRTRGAVYCFGAT
jgi:outer membrane protein assembly factor BamB